MASAAQPLNPPYGPVGTQYRIMRRANLAQNLNKVVKYLGTYPDNPNRHIFDPYPNGPELYIIDEPTPSNPNPNNQFIVMVAGGGRRKSRRSKRKIRRTRHKGRRHH
jgi:hypothetical protein